MRRVQRLGGKMMKRSADQADVGTVIAEFKAMDEMLGNLSKDLAAWRNGWEDVLKLQYDASEAFATLYKAIEPTDAPEMRNEPAVTPPRFMQKCLSLQKMYSEMKDDLAQEIGMITTKLVRPVEEAKANCKVLYKTLKHRENMKLDYERYLGRAEHARRKETRTVKEEMTLTKCEGDLAQAEIDYQTADDQVKQTFPPVTEAVMALMPYLATSQIMLQTTLVGQIYTMLDAYCKRQGLPSPAPSEAEIVSKWEGEYTMFRKELESGLSLVANGKAVRAPMTIPEKSGTVTGLGIRNKVMSRKASNQTFPTQRRDASPSLSITAAPRTQQDDEVAPLKPPRPNGTPSPGSFGMPSPSIPLSSKPRIPSYGSQQSLSAAPYDQKPASLTPYDQKPTALIPSYPSTPQPAIASASTPSSLYATPLASAASNRSGDYFGTASHDQRRASAASFASSAASVVAGKKKPPPPVPVKRLPSSQAQFVIALYDFEGQNAGDLAFRQGDRIRVVKKTESTDDWWEGENEGKTGSFPANYVRL